MTTDVRNTDDVIDSRDVIARIEELEAERDAFVLGAPDGTETPDPEGWARENEDDAEELRALIALRDEAEPYAADWEYGETLIRDSYFETYAEELANDIGAIKSDAGWPLSYIDWSAAAEALQQDYTAVDFDGVRYWVR